MVSSRQQQSMADHEQSIIHRKICLIYTQPVADVLEGGRQMFRALAPCPMWGEHDDRPGIDVLLSRRALVFNRWHMYLPKKRVFLTREMMGL